MTKPVLSIEALKELLINTIQKELRHKHYQRTVDLAKFYRQIVTGEDQDELIISYKLRETDDQKKARIRLTNSRTQYVSGRIIQTYAKIERSDNIVDNIKYETDSASKNLELLDSRLAEFYEGKHLDNYLFEALELIVFIDANAFMVCELDNSDPINSYPTTYPFEVSAEQAINFHYKNGILQWLICELPHKYIKYDRERTEEHKGSRFTIYAADYAIVCEHADLRDGKPILKEGWILLNIKKGDDDCWYYYREYITMSKVCPARRVGYIKDPETQGQTCLSPLHKAEKIFRDLVNAKSEYDLSRALHGFMQKYVYAPPCDNVSEGDKCRNGYFNDGKKCDVCKGKGVMVHTTVQDAILLKMPDSKEEHIPLSEMVHYVQIPDYILTNQVQELERLEVKTATAIFNTNVFDRSDVAITATEKRIDLDSVYNALSQYAANYSELKKFFVTLTAIHLRIDDGLIVEHEFPSDFALESLDQLLLQRKAAIDAGAPYQIISRIDNAIMMKQNQDDPDTVLFNQAMNRFRPFREKTPEERMFIIGTLEEDDKNKVLWIYFEDVFNDIKHTETAPFHQMKYARQKETVEKYLQPYVDAAKLKKEENKAMQLSIQGGFQGEDPNDEDEGQEDTTTDE